MRSYRNIIWDVYAQQYGTRPDKLMGFYVRQNTEQDELRALFVRNLGNGSSAGSESNLGDDCSFLRVAP
ncbi:MAG: hypothetical protein AABX13_04795 [Nanoarchaeota archaeon]